MLLARRLQYFAKRLGPPGKARRLLLAGLIVLILLTGCLGLPPLGPTSTPLRPTDTPSATLPAAPDPYTGAGFDAFITEVQGSLPSGRPALVSRYVAQLPSAPLIDGNRVIFFWRGTGASVHVAGDMNNWDPAAEPTLQQVEGADLWYGEGEYELDARLDYKFVVDGQRWELDPLNPRTMLGGLGPNSELAMPEYLTPAEALPQATPAPSGVLTNHTLESAALGQVRTFFVYTPASALLGEKPATVYIHDGGEYINLIDAPVMLDNLIAAGDIPPLVAVFIPPVQRELEYYLNDNYVRFLADELTPFMEANYDVSPEPGRTANLGASLGGLLAVYAAATRPDTFGLAAGYSGAYSLGNDLVIELLRREETLPLRFYLVVGTYETAIGGDPNTGNLLEANRRLARTLHDRFYDYQYAEAPQGHSWGLWRDYFGDGLRFLFQP